MDPKDNAQVCIDRQNAIIYAELMDKAIHFILADPGNYDCPDAQERLSILKGLADVQFELTH